MIVRSSAAADPDAPRTGCGRSGTSLYQFDDAAKTIAKTQERARRSARVGKQRGAVLGVAALVAVDSSVTRAHYARVHDGGDLGRRGEILERPRRCRGSRSRRGAAASAPLPRERISEMPSSSRSQPSSRACGSRSRSVRRTSWAIGTRLRRPVTRSITGAVQPVPRGEPLVLGGQDRGGSSAPSRPTRRARRAS